MRAVKKGIYFYTGMVFSTQPNDCIS